MTATATVVGTMRPAEEGDAVQVVRAVGFLDLAGYTSLTDVHGDQAAADVDRFCAVVRDPLREQDVLVKSIGDAVLMHSSGADALAALSARVCAEPVQEGVVRTSSSR